MTTNFLQTKEDQDQLKKEYWGETSYKTIPAGEGEVIYQKEMTIADRAQSYNTTFPKYPPVYAAGDWLYGMWMIGNYYKRKYDYYGAYPPSYLRRIHSLFPDKTNILQLFSGMLDKEEAKGIRFDIKDNNRMIDVVGDVNQIHNIFKPNSFDLVIADPPYTPKDFEKYNTKTFNKRITLKNIVQIIKPGGHLVWLDLSIPIYTKVNYKLIGTIGLLTGTNRKVRITSIFERV